ncbi:MAG TPA: hypothetical protein EYQ06_00005 [Flavobacteriales bacterium]|nr:hypothetical protein [Flavobacteriales bacterium]
MKNIVLILISVSLFLSSCKKCKDCIRIFETEFTPIELDSISQNIYREVGGYTLPNGNTIDTFFAYTSWADFSLFNLNDLNKEHQYCNNSFTTGPTNSLTERENLDESWRSNGTIYNDGTDSSVFILGTSYYNCR